MNRRALMMAAAGVTMLLAACTEADKVDVGTKGEGEGCSQVSDCEAGYECPAGTCKAIALTTGVLRGTPCDDDTDCGPALVCGPQRACGPFHGSQLDEPCGLTEDCVPPLVCHGNRSVCVEVGDPNPDDANATAGFGVKNLGEACGTFTECRKPFLCATAAPSPTCEQIPIYLGPTCIRTEEEQGAFRPYFEIPPDSLPADFEFYRLPFPNDILMVNGKVSLAGHPAPGAVLGIDIAGSYFGAVEEGADGFAINGAVFFRFTDPPVPGSLCVDEGGQYVTGGGATFCTGGGPGTVYLVNIDPDSAAYGERVPVQLALFPERSQYMCENGLGIGPLDGEPLEHGTTYAAVVTTGLRDVRGSAPVQDRDFVRVLQADPSLPQAVLAATAPLRAWIADKGIDASTIAVASVFTTMHPDAMAARIRDAVYALSPPPAFTGDVFECTAPPASFVCHQPAAVRRCSPPSADYYEVQGTYRAPAFQEGTRPFLLASDGGALSLDANGTPQKVFDETMCFALTIPKSGAMPAGGWPVLIYAHGTGADYRSFVGDEVMRIANSLGFAVISFDNVMHGPRQDPSEDPAGWQPSKWELVDPGRYFFNVLNPYAARDNVLQGTADLYSLTRLVREGGGLTAATTGEILEIRFDPSQVVFFGHSQGTVIAPAYVAGESHLKAAVFSGAGAELALSILNKRKPVNLAEVAGALLADRRLTRVHPMLSIMALAFGPADSLSYAKGLVAGTGRPFLMFSGLGDSYTPQVTQQALLRAAGIPLVRPVVESVAGVAEIDAPVGGNLDGATVGAVQLAPDSYDGHFVVYKHAAAAAVLQGFLASVKNGAARIER